MEFPQDATQLLQSLLPGFVMAWVFYNLTSYQKPSQFERVIQALVFNLIIQLFVFPTRFLLLKLGHSWSLGEWTSSSELAVSGLWALVLGITFSCFANNDSLHKILRLLRVTVETSYPSEWFRAFQQNVTFVILHLNDERRIYGWPVEWPSDPAEGYFVLTDISWLLDPQETTSAPPLERPLTGVNSMLINVKDVKWVEFLEKSWETKNGEESIQSTITETDLIDRKEGDK